MEALYIIVCVLGGLAAYGFVGWKFAVTDMPNAWTRARKQWTSRDLVESSVRAQSIFMVLFWPVLAPIRVFAMALNKTMRETDPKVLRERLKAQEVQARLNEATQRMEIFKRDQEIDRLERELKVGPYKEEN